MPKLQEHRGLEPAPTGALGSLVQALVGAGSSPRCSWLLHLGSCTWAPALGLLHLGSACGSGLQPAMLLDLGNLPFRIQPSTDESLPPGNHHARMYTHITRGSHQLRMHRTLATALITVCCADRQPLLADPGAAAIVLDSLLWHDAQRRLLLHAAAVMPDHLHFVADPLGTDWCALLRSMKSFTAHQINLRLQRAGSVWQVQYHDRRITTDTQLLMAVDYCLQNPVRAGLVSAAGEWGPSWSRFAWE